MASISARSTNSIKTSVFTKIKKIIFSTQGLPLLLVITIISILFVLFRMKSVEIDYQINEITNTTKRVKIENKELEARKARLLSNNNLRKLAKKHGLAEPKQSQIIIIPDKIK
ncbi:MAG: hypothetical protein HOJ35_13110 [Bdellovibrionales bacterium]|jgi:cell division protein FtsL|nr:hypothetical protein [Bdellovibrionales bacterium]